MEPKKLASFGELFDQAIAKYKLLWKELVKVVLVPMLAGGVIIALAVLLLVGGTLEHTSGLFSFGIFAIDFVLGVLAMYIFLTGSIGLMFVIAEGTATQGGWSGALRRARPLVPSYFVLTFMLCLSMLGGYALVLIPGIYVSGLLSCAGWVFLLENKRGWAAITRSAQLAYGRWWPVFGRVCIAGLLAAVVNAILSAILRPLHIDFIASIVSALVFQPIVVIFVYQLYLSLKETYVETEISRNEAGFKKQLTGFMAVGVLGAICFLVLIPVLVTVMTLFVPMLNQVSISTPSFDYASSTYQIEAPLATSTLPY